MSSFKLAFHSLTGRRIVEIWNGDELLGAIYPADDGVKIISKHPMVAVCEEPEGLPGAVNVAIVPKRN